MELTKITRSVLSNDLLNSLSASLALEIDTNKTGQTIIKSDKTISTTSRLHMAPDGAGWSWISAGGNNHVNALSSISHHGEALGFHQGPDGGVDAATLQALSGTNRCRLLVNPTDIHVIKGSSGNEVMEAVVTRPLYQLYVDPINGNDNHNGVSPTIVTANNSSDDTINGPFKTLHKALQTCHNDFVTAAGTINLAPGTYDPDPDDYWQNDWGFNQPFLFGAGQNLTIVGTRGITLSSYDTTANGITITTTNGPSLCAENLQVNIGGFATAAINEMGTADYLHISHTEGMDVLPFPIGITTTAGSPTIKSTCNEYTKNANGDYIGDRKQDLRARYEIAANDLNWSRNHVLIGTQKFDLNTISKDAANPTEWTATTNATTSQIVSLMFVGDPLNKLHEAVLYAGVVNDVVNPTNLGSFDIKVTTGAAALIERGDLIYINNACGSVESKNGQVITLDVPGILVDSTSDPRLGQAGQIPFFIKKHHEVLSGSWKIVSKDASAGTITLSSDHLSNNSWWSKIVKTINEEFVNPSLSVTLYDVPTKGIRRIQGYTTPTKIKLQKNKTIFLQGDQCVFKHLHIDKEQSNMDLSGGSRTLEAHGTDVSLNGVAITNTLDGIALHRGSKLIGDNEGNEDFGGGRIYRYQSRPSMFSGLAGTAIWCSDDGMSSVSRFPLIVNGASYGAIGAFNSSYSFRELKTIFCATGISLQHNGYAEVMGPIFTISQYPLRLNSQASCFIHSTSVASYSDANQRYPFTPGGFYKAGFKTYGEGTGVGQSVVITHAVSVSVDSSLEIFDLPHWRTSTSGCELIVIENSVCRIHWTSFFGLPNRSVDGFVPYVYGQSPLVKHKPFSYVAISNLSLYDCVVAGFSRAGAIHRDARLETSGTTYIDVSRGPEIGWKSQYHCVSNVFRPGKMADTNYPYGWLAAGSFAHSFNVFIDSRVEFPYGIIVDVPASLKVPYGSGSPWVLLYSITSAYNTDNNVLVHRTNSTLTGQQICDTSIGFDWEVIDGNDSPNSTVSPWTSPKNNKLIITST
jgi:hypothetical protein